MHEGNDSEPAVGSDEQDADRVVSPGADATFQGLADEYVARLRAGEAIDPEAYAAEHPDLAVRIRDLFPVLAMMEGLKPPTSASVPTEVPEPVPVRIGPYTVLREIGHGGMGRVFEAESGGGERVALKVVHAHLLSRPGYLARFLREVEAGRRVEHPNLVRTLGSGIHEKGGLETPYLALEYMEGQNLRELLAEAGTISERLAREIGTQVAQALAAVHAADMVHRDVKPENVVIAPDESVKLMDLGVALVGEEAMRLTQTGEFVGSLLYASPEQLRGDSLDARADLYSLGLLLYELVAGHHPNVAAGTTGRRRPWPDGARRPLTETAPHVSPFFGALVTRLTAVEPDARFRDAAEVALVLAAGESSDWWQEEGFRRGAAALAQSATSFFGRDEDLTVLADAYADVSNGDRRSVLLEGEAGIGKSRLVAEWLRQVRADTPDGPRSLIVRHEPEGEALAVPPLAAALREALLGPDRRERLERYLGAHAGLVAAMERHLDGEELEGDGPTLSAAARGTAYRNLLRGMAEERPLVVVMEDLHFASEEARAIHLLLVRGLAGAPVLLLATVRPDTAGVWPEDLEQADHARRHALLGLEPASAHALIRASLGRESTLETGLRDFVSHAEGNPFCLLEFAREFRERGARAEGDVGIPQSVRELVEARLHALEPSDRDLLSVAACAGDPFDPVLVCEAADIPRIAGLRRIHELHRVRDLLRAEGPAYRFQHHLVREVLHDELPAALRASYHVALGSALEARTPERTRSLLEGPPAVALARHFLLGESPRRALPYAGGAVAHLHEEREWHRAVEVADGVLALPEGVSPEERARLLIVRGMSLLSYAPAAEALEALVEAREAGSALDDDLLAARAATGLAVCYRHSGQNESALEVHKEAVARAARLGVHQEHARALGFLSLTLAEVGRLGEARDTAERGLAIAKELGDTSTTAEIARHLGSIELDQGHLARARQLLDHVLSVGEFYGDVTLIQNALQLLGKLAYLEGNLDETLEMTERLLQHQVLEGHARMEAIGRVNLAAIHSKRGDVAREEEEARAALAIAKRMGYTDVLAHARSALGTCREHTADLTAAESEYRGAYETAVSLKQPIFVARMGIPLARLLARTGRLAEARVLVEEARKGVETMSAVREVAHVRNLEADVIEAGGDDERAAERWQESADELEAAGMVQDSAWSRLRYAQALVRLGRDGDAAREQLLRAREGLERAGLRVHAAEATVWLESLPGGDPLLARQALDKHGGGMTLAVRSAAEFVLGRATQDVRLLAEARAHLEHLIEGTAEEHRDGMRNLPAHARILEYPLPS